MKLYIIKKQSRKMKIKTDNFMCSTLCNFCCCCRMKQLRRSCLAPTDTSPLEDRGSGLALISHHFLLFLQLRLAISGYNWLANTKLVCAYPGASFLLISSSCKMV